MENHTRLLKKKTRSPLNSETESSRLFPLLGVSNQAPMSYTTHHSEFSQPEETGNGYLSQFKTRIQPNILDCSLGRPEQRIEWQMRNTMMSEL